MMTYHMFIGKITMQLSKSLSEYIEDECKSNGWEPKELLGEMLQLLQGDMTMMFEIEHLANLKTHQSLKPEEKQVTGKQGWDYTEKGIEYYQLLIEGKVPQQFIMIFPGLISHFLFNEYGLDGMPVLEYCVGTLSEFDYQKHEDWYNLLLKQVYFVETARQMIYIVSQQQMKMMEQMMSGEIDPQVVQQQMARAMQQMQQMGGNPGQPNPEQAQMSEEEKMKNLQSAMQNLDFEQFMPVMQDMMQKMMQPPKKD